MKTATTLYKTAKGWSLKFGPDTKFEEQKLAFRAAQQSWPKDVLAIQFQTNQGTARLLDNVKAERTKDRLVQATLRAEAKSILATLQGKIHGYEVRINELTPRVARERERIAVFKDKAERSGDNKFTEAFLIEHKQAVATLKSLEKDLAESQAALAKLQSEIANTKTKI